jgi:hypothetical protein
MKSNGIDPVALGFTIVSLSVALEETLKALAEKNGQEGSWLEEECRHCLEAVGQEEGVESVTTRPTRQAPRSMGLLRGSSTPGVEGRFGSIASLIERLLSKQCGRGVPSTDRRALRGAGGQAIASELGVNCKTPGKYHS